MPRILVADDNTNIQKMVALALQERGVEVTSVGNGEAAVRRLPDLNPDLILADIFMPVRNGYEVCEWVKKESKFSHIPVILLVGAFDPLDEKEARRVGADGILKKPFIPPDPLIAMVTATLEKNPKIAAEMAQAREAKEAKAAAPPAPAPVTHEIPRKIELQPVTEIPEPSADDASLAYGFGAGRRDIEDDGHDETAAGRAPKSDFDKKSDEEFDGASTTSDWRRNAMSFEVPEEASRMPAFSTDEESEPAGASNTSSIGNAIPAPPVVELPQMEIPGAIEASVIEVKPAEVEAAVSEEQLQSFHTAVENGEHPSEGHSEWASDEPDVHIDSAQADSMIAEPEVAASPVSEAGELTAALATAKEESSTSHVSAQEPSATAKPSHWMDLMATTSGQPQSDWLSLINAQSNGDSEARSSVESKTAEPSTAERDSLSHKIEEPPAPDDLSDLPALQGSAGEIPQHSDALPRYESDVTEAGAIVEKTEEEDWFFADEPTGDAAPQAEPAVPSGANVTSSQSQEQAPTAILSDAPSSEQIPSASKETDLGEFEATVAEPVAITSPQEEEVDFFDEPSAKAVASSEPDLIESPAVHVTPEPLLVDEAPQKGSAAYGHSDQDIAPTYEFLPQVEGKATESSDSLRASAEIAQERQPSSSEKEVSLGESNTTSVLEHPAVTNAEAEVPETSAAAGDRNPEVAASLGLNEAARKFLRPTAREQLAHIPFLNPPPDFDAASEPKPAELNPASEAQAVETVVQRILDKIEPQLHDLLAQNLKPLIENLVNAELQKKD